MRLRSTLFLLTLTLTACGGKTDGADSSTGDAKLKQEAASALSAGTAVGDPCTTHAWYGDGTCDSFCPKADTDCVPTGEPVVCAMFAEVSDGTCGREADDPCRFQDPDCTASSPVPGTTDPSDPIVCAMLVELSDGKCSRATSDPCAFQDPDCTSPSGTVDCDQRKITCETFAAVTCREGQVPSVVNGCYGDCVDQSACEPIACPAIAMVSDGLCSLPSTDPCQGIDPDCGVACAEYIEQADGVCSREATDPCLFQDPDCTTKTPDCDLSHVQCNSIAPTCPEGQVPTVVDRCYGDCVDQSACEPVACTAYIEVSDGECSRPATDPCRSQDPDCVTPVPAL